MDERLLQKYMAGDVSESEKEAVARWLDADSGNMRRYAALRKLFDISLWHEPEAACARTPKKRAAAARRLLETLKIAAIVAVAFLAGKRLYSSGDNVGGAAMQSLHVPFGQHAELVLSDGSKVWLNAGSALRFPDRFDKGLRAVSLEGEGFFEVSADASRPFVVNAGKYSVKALGTSFNVLAYPGAMDMFEAALLEGSVEVSDGAGGAAVMLSPDNRVALEGGRLTVSKIPDKDYFLWREGILSFDDEPIMDIIKKLELHFNARIVVKDSFILENRYCYTGKFRTRDGLEHALKVLQVKKPFKYERDDEENIIMIY